ncbi:MAG: type II secretion system protein [Candidatus Riflebacteria bacterium]|nr:type II secretion system protein [Candidatus Riflebacteria bacterium]
MNRYKRFHRGSDGFSLLEILVVIAIVAILGVLAIGYFMDYSQQAKEAAARVNLASVREALARYFKANMAYPKSLDSLKGSYLMDPVTDMLIAPLAPASAAIYVEVPTTDTSPNGFLATSAEKIPYPGDGVRQIRNVWIKVDQTIRTDW